MHEGCSVPLAILTRLVLGGVGLVNLVVKPHVGHSHAVLREGPCLV